MHLLRKYNTHIYDIYTIQLKLSYGVYQVFNKHLSYARLLHLLLRKS